MKAKGSIMSKREITSIGFLGVITSVLMDAPRWMVTVFGGSTDGSFYKRI